MNIIRNPQVDQVFESYPEVAREKIRNLRDLVLDTANKTDGISSLEETLKWGEPSYVSDIGSTIRMSWKESDPNTYRLYFICSTKLVDTFKEIYGDTFTYESNRALVFQLNDELPAQEIKHCCSLALSYHTLKHLPLLGA